MWETIIGVVATFAVTILATWRHWRKFKTKLKAVREFVDTLDDALYDNSVSEEEYRALFEKFKKIIEDP